MYLSGFLYYLNIAKSLFHYKMFKRTDKDYYHLGNSYLLAGNYRIGLQEFYNIKEATSETYNAISMAYFCLGDFKNAFKNIEKSLMIAVWSEPIRLHKN